MTSDKKKYSIKDVVWIHIGEAKLVEGRVVEIFDLKHLNENQEHNDLYIVEIPTAIEPIYEVRSWEQISSTALGPINLYKDLNTQEGQRYLKKVGVVLPVAEPAAAAEVVADETPAQKPKKKFHFRKKKDAVSS